MEQEMISLAAKIEPGLAMGTYTLSVKQESTIPQSAIEPATFSFRNGAAPYAVAAEDIYSVYPPKEAFGQFERVLPNLVLTNRGLPWERRVEKADGIPWLALLLFDETEGVQELSLSSREAFTQSEKRFCPVQYDSAMPENCMVLDVPAGLFAGVCPAAEDLALCAHARCVCRDNKVTEDNPPEEWLSVLLSTRYPAAASGEKGIKNSCCLVSLEAFGEFLTDSALREEIARGERYETVRIPLLYSWSFYCAAEEFDFKTVFKNLGADAFQLTEQEKGSLTEELRNLLAMGYAPVDHYLRDGSSTVSFYRGPFAAKHEEQEGTEPKMNGDAWLRYDPEMGMLDITYSAAYCLGRQLAMQNAAYASSLHTWRSANKAEAGRIRRRYQLACRLKLHEDIIDRCLEQFRDNRQEPFPDNISGIEGTEQYGALLEECIREQLSRAAGALVGEERKS